MRVQKTKLQPTAMHSLSDEEMRNPHLVLEELFDFADIEDIRALLWQWLKTTATASYHKQLNSEERTVIFDLYEKIKKLVEASYLLHRAQAKNGRNKLNRL